MMLKKITLSMMAIAGFCATAHADDVNELIVGPVQSLAEYAGSPWYITEKSVGDYVVLSVNTEFSGLALHELESQYEVVDASTIEYAPKSVFVSPTAGIVNQASVDDFNDVFSVRQDSFSWSNHEIFAGMSALKESKHKPVVVVFAEGSTAHPDVKTVGGFDYVGESESYGSTGSSCQLTKGLGMSALIGATNNNTIGIAGIAGNAELYMAKVDDANCDTLTYEQSPSAVFEALEDIASSDNAMGSPTPDVVLISQHFEGPCPTSFQSAIDELVDNNVTIVASSGDEGGLVGNYYPANCQNVVTVASVDEIGRPESDSNLSVHVDVTAPGESFVPLTGNDSWGKVNSSNYAAAKTAGAIALVKSNYPELGVEQVYSAVVESAVPYSEIAGDCTMGDYCGEGYLNVKQFVEYANSVYDPVYDFAHAFTDDDCLAEREIEALSTHMDVCAAFKTTVTMSYADSSFDHEYRFKLIQRPEGTSTWYNEVNPVTGKYAPGQDNGIEVISTYSSLQQAKDAVVLPLLDVDDGEYDYAIASCVASAEYGGQWSTEGKLIDGELCFGITELDSSSVTLPAYCE
ncbi:hypothetical protein BM525_18700 (plasmid) [Alteromonas mediterranea]|uniref:Peptidase S8/S53 domain-containing protein n=1 Tax=Alteromonas mediterranea TaxID=314275 RepID=A0AAC9JHB6_9ALTE|nr:S8 family serine peptidase [Alteromonas mediterranea]APD91912.1 hypothetical protein BM524_18505 [Alteromonas mediterranea]APD99766.1 hypothetical protein BM525_18700 [Alteromonas mediterranea]